MHRITQKSATISERKACLRSPCQKASALTRGVDCQTSAEHLVKHCFRFLQELKEYLYSAMSVLARLQFHPTVACKMYRVLQAVVIAVSKAASRFRLCCCAALPAAWSPSPHWARCHSPAALPSPLKTFWTLAGCCAPHCLPHPPLGALTACASITGPDQYHTP